MPESGRQPSSHELDSMLDCKILRCIVFTLETSMIDERFSFLRLPRVPPQNQPACIVILILILKMSFLPEPARMMLTNPRLFDFSSDGPIPYVMRQKFTSIPSPSANFSLSGKTVLVTGATSGVGYETARQILQLGANLIVGARSIERAEKIRDEFQAEMSESSIRIHEVNMESLDSVDKFISQLSADKITLDMAILNAGLFRRGREPVDGGWSQLMQVNFRSTAYLSLRLASWFQTEEVNSTSGSDKPTARLVLVSSEAHAWSTYALASRHDVLSDFKDAKAGSIQPEYEYYTAKLFLALFGREMASRIESQALHVVTTTPGFCASGFFPDATSLPTKLIYWTQARTLGQGARLHVHAATSTEPDLSGKYMRDGRVNKYDSSHPSSHPSIIPMQRATRKKKRVFTNVNPKPDYRHLPSRPMGMSFKGVSGVK